MSHKPHPDSGVFTCSWVETNRSRKTCLSNDRDLTDDTGDPLGGTPDADNVTTRAEGRPPEEESSEYPAAQAEATLQESEDSIAHGADGSEPITE